MLWSEPAAINRQPLHFNVSSAPAEFCLVGVKTAPNVFVLGLVMAIVPVNLVPRTHDWP
jgi:hypothetical protein